MDPNRVTMYVCGPTVYNYVHIGNARPVIVFDILYRVLQSLYPQVIYTRNITDIDDKIIHAAQEEGVDIDTITERYAAAYNKHMLALHNLEPTSAPRATQFVPQMIEMIETLVAKGHAYEAAGEVLFDVQSMPDYGGLSGQNLEALQAGASERVELDQHKKHPGDFVLWKPSNDDEPGWESPWGRGRPGWHTECVVMINSLLGENIDIHGGGKDLIFPHHENELAQNVCAHGSGPYVNYWMHNAFINFEGEKMSKSLGNFRTVRDLLDVYKGEVLRFAILSAHYRSEMDFSKDVLDQSKSSLDSLYTALHDAQDVALDDSVKLDDSPVYQALLDDLNTPIAVSELHALAKELNKAADADKARLKTLLLKSAELLGVLVEEPEQWFKSAVGDAISAEAIEQLVADRDAAKKAKNYQRADEIRDQLKDAGVILEDSREGTRWRRQ